MVQITFIDANGQEKTVEAEEDLSLMVAATDHAIEGIEAICSGCCSCGTCHVVLPIGTPDIVPAYLGEEQILEKTMNREPGSRLSCQVTVRPSHEGLVVQVRPVEFVD
ncbi:MAG: 2Fe-2S iron-sulfur cluster binding domain-containing protein [Kordiimonadaceae bacterium]|nr:2Fe-2S iron-sulfur cluster binding domain-containing protein [Kordiimonadaceae bacterium]MBT6033692.1 2Fe-2S iron-sulfur cluster binding domain-containing protein [Kordiimonadaceae bacterium]